MRLSVTGISPAIWDRKMCDTGGLSSNSRVPVRRVQAFDFLHNLLNDWHWWSISGSSQGPPAFT